MTRKISLLAIGLIVIIVVLLGVKWWIYDREQAVHTELNSEQQRSAKAVITSLAKELNVKVETDELDPGTAEWLRDDNTYVSLKGYTLTLGNEEISNGYPVVYQPMKFEEVNEPYLRVLATLVDESFQKNGLISSKPNTENVPTDLYAFKRGFEKDDIKCVATYSNNSNPYAFIYCGVEDLLSAKWRAELTSAFNPNNDPRVVINPEKIIGRFASAGIGSRTEGGGYFAWATKKNGQWEKIYEGQDSPRCSEVMRLRVPKGIYGQCYDENTGLAR